MKNFLINYKINIFFLLISFFFLVGAIGLENISAYSTQWLHTGNDSASQQLGWHFFKNDVWRFPLGSNPNYGDELGSSIVYTDSIPILAFIFKLFKNLIHENFQYFSLWYFLCFYLQLYFSFKILRSFTHSDLYSFVGSLFFLIAPILIFRLNIGHSTIIGHWILLFTLYLILTKSLEESNVKWLFLIILSSLIMYNFTVVILTSYFLLRIFNLKLNKEKIFRFIKDFFIIFICLIIVLYVVGYFQIRMADTLALGFGSNKLNLLSVFDPVSTQDKVAFTWFLPDIKLTAGEEGEGFNYFGLGQILMMFFSLILLFINSYSKNLTSIKENKKIKLFIIVSIILTLWALSNKISFGSFTILEIPINKYIYAIMSMAKNTGRLFWIVNYFLLILSILIIYKCFNKKNSLLLIIIFFLIQLADTSPALKRFVQTESNEPNFLLKDKIWDKLFNEDTVIKGTYLINYPGFFSAASYSMEKNNIKKTNVVKFARANRKAAAAGRYWLYENLRNKKLSSQSVYIVDQGHLNHIKYLFKNEDVGFFYRDSFWAMALNKKNQMNKNDLKVFNNIKPKLLEINKNEILKFKDKNNYYGLGWSHNFEQIGIWSEGYQSTLLFRIKENYGKIKFKFICEPYLTKKNENSKFDIYVNDVFYKNFSINKNNFGEDLEVLISEDLIKNNKIKINFNFKNPISPYEVFESPDSRKLGILLKSIKISKI